MGGRVQYVILIPHEIRREIFQEVYVESSAVPEVRRDPVPGVYEKTPYDKELLCRELMKI